MRKYRNPLLFVIGVVGICAAYITGIQHITTYENGVEYYRILPFPIAVAILLISIVLVLISVFSTLYSVRNKSNTRLDTSHYMR